MTSSTSITEKFINYIVNNFADNELNRLPKKFGGKRIFDRQLLGVSSGADPIWIKFKEVVDVRHLTPIEIWKSAGLPEEDPGTLRIASIVFPYTSAIREAFEPGISTNSVTQLPSEMYCVGRNYFEAFMVDLIEGTIAFLNDSGYKATAGLFSPAYEMINYHQPNIASSWSERHVAFAAGLGTFSLNEALITESGCNVRLASVITNAPLSITHRKSDEPYGNCLYYSKGICRECEKKCPANAINQDGHDKQKCRQYIAIVGEEMKQRLNSYLKVKQRHIDGKLLSASPVGCAFCQFGVPCMDRNPMGD